MDGLSMFHARSNAYSGGLVFYSGRSRCCLVPEAINDVDKQLITFFNFDHGQRLLVVDANKRTIVHPIGVGSDLGNVPVIYDNPRLARVKQKTRYGLGFC